MRSLRPLFITEFQPRLPGFPLSVVHLKQGTGLALLRMMEDGHVLILAISRRRRSVNVLTHHDAKGADRFHRAGGGACCKAEAAGEEKRKEKESFHMMDHRSGRANGVSCRFAHRTKHHERTRRMRFSRCRKGGARTSGGASEGAVTSPKLGKTQGQNGKMHGSEPGRPDQHDAQSPMVQGLRRRVRCWHL